MNYQKMIGELQSKMQANTEDMEVLINLAKTESDRDLTEDEQTKFDGLVESSDDIVKRIENLRTLQDQQQRATVVETVKDFSKPEIAQSLQRGNSIEAKDVSIPTNAFRHAPAQLHLKGADAEKRTYMFGVWAAAAMGHEASRVKCNEWGLSLQAVHEGSVNTTGGYLVPAQLDADIISLINTYGLARQLARVTPMTTDVLRRPRRTGGLTATWEGESDAIAESTKAWDNVSLVAKKLAVITRISNELNEDAIISVANDLVREIAIAFAQKEDEAYFNGDGGLPYGGITGFEGKFDAIAAGLGAGTAGGGLQIATGNNMTEIDLPDLSETAARLPIFGDNVNTVFVCHKVFYWNVIIRLTSALSGNTQQSVELAVRNQLWGYPVLFSNAMPSTDTITNQVVLLFGDFTLASMFGDRRARTISFSDSASLGSGDNVFLKDQMAIRGTERIDINVHDVGTGSVAGPVVALMGLNA
jgi:HK97 family phage major capsid protein